MVHATQYMIGIAIVGMTNPYGVAAMDGLQISKQALAGCFEPMACFRSSSPVWRIRET